MKLLWHLVRTDLRRHRWMLAGWIAALFVSAVCEGLCFWLHFSSWDRDVLEFLQFTSGLATVVAWALTVVLAADFILNDGLGKPTAFWKPRPIGAARLLAAKACELGILIVVPVIFYCVLLAVNGATAGQLGLAAIGALLWRSVVVLGVAAIATSAEGLGGFFIRGLAVLIASRFLATFVGALVTVRSLMGNAPPESDSLFASGLLAAKVLAVLLGFLLLISSYLVAHRRHVWIRLYLGAFLVMVTPTLWTWDFLGASSAPLDESVRPHFAVQVLTVRQGLRIEKTPVIAGDVSAVALGDGAVAVPRGARRVSVSGHAGVLTTMPSIPSVVRLMNRDDIVSIDPGALQQVLDGARLLNVPEKEGVALPFFTLREEMRRNFPSGPVQVRADIDAERCRYVAEPEIPLQKDTKARSAMGLTRLLGVTSKQQGVRVDLEEQEFRSNLTGTSFLGLMFSSLTLRAGVPFGGAEWRPVAYVLVNRSRAEAFLQLRGQSTTERSVSLGELKRRRRSVAFDVEPSGVAADEWLKNATLVRVRLVSEGQIIGTLKSDGVALNLGGETKSTSK